VKHEKKNEVTTPPKPKKATGTKLMAMGTQQSHGNGPTCYEKGMKAMWTDFVTQFRGSILKKLPKTLGLTITKTPILKST
jgi:hypothetical protein